MYAMDKRKSWFDLVSRWCIGGWTLDLTRSIHNADDGIWTHKPKHMILNHACIPIPPHRHIALVGLEPTYWRNQNPLPYPLGERAFYWCRWWDSNPHARGIWFWVKQVYQFHHIDIRSPVRQRENILHDYRKERRTSCKRVVLPGGLEPTTNWI